MKKTALLGVALALIGLAASLPVQAEEGGMLEITGNIATVTGWQRARQGRYLDTTSGVLADGLAVPGAAGTAQFGFFVDQVEIDLAKNFGENVRFRSDLDFFPFTGGATPGRFTAVTGGGGTGDFVVEQSYVTANLPAGNGWELLVGRFNSGIGLDPTDRGELSTVSFSSTHRVLLPHNMTGARLGYNFTDMFRWEMYAVNNLADSAPGATTNIPSFGFNAINSYGDEGNKSWVKLSGAIGPERATNTPYSYLGDLAISHATSDTFRVGVEGTFRQDNAATNRKYLGGNLQGTYSFSDVWDGTLRYGYTWDVNTGQAAAVASANNEFAPGLGGAAGGGLSHGAVRHDLTLATGYSITEAARFGLEGRFDLTAPSGAAATEAAGVSGHNLGLAGMFAYNF